jgi:hypothetical protein
LFGTCTGSSAHTLGEPSAFHFLFDLGSFSRSLLTHHISSHLLEILPWQPSHGLSDCLASGSLWCSTLLHEPLHLRLKASFKYTLCSWQRTFKRSVLVGNLPNRSASCISSGAKLHQRSVALSLGHCVQLGFYPSHKLWLQHRVGVARSAELRSYCWTWALKQRRLSKQ